MMTYWQIGLFAFQFIGLSVLGWKGLELQFRIEAVEEEQALRTATEQAMLAGAKKEGYGY